MGCGCFTITQNRGRSNGYRKTFKDYDVVPVSSSVASSEKDLLEIERAEQKGGVKSSGYRSSTKVLPSVKELANDKRLPPVKETHILIHNEDFEGNKMINEYVRQCKIGSGSYCKVVLHRSNKDGNLYAVKVFHKARLCKIRASHSGNAMAKVLTEVSILKQVDHPNIVKLIEVIDDPDSDRFYMVLQYMERGWIFKGSGPPGGIGEDIARKYFQDIVAGLKYLHKNNIVHGDIKPENLLVSSDGRVKICDFSESCKFEDDNDELKRSAGTPVFTAPECSQGSVYHGKVADIWALGITLYCMVLGQFPFIGETLRETFHKVTTSIQVSKERFQRLIDEGSMILFPKDIQSFTTTNEVPALITDNRTSGNRAVIEQLSLPNTLIIDSRFKETAYQDGNTPSTNSSENNNEQWEADDHRQGNEIE